MTFNTTQMNGKGAILFFMSIAFGKSNLYHVISTVMNVLDQILKDSASQQKVHLMPYSELQRKLRRSALKKLFAQGYFCIFLI